MSGTITVLDSGTPTIGVQPLSLGASAQTGELVTLPMTIGNSGSADLNWTAHMSATGCGVADVLPWLFQTPTNGIVVAGDVPTTVNVTMTASGLDTGTHQANLCIQSNDTAQPLVDVPVAFTVDDTGTILRNGFEAAVVVGPPMRRNILSLSASEITELQNALAEQQARSLPVDFASPTYLTSFDLWASIHGIVGALPADNTAAALLQQCQHGTGLFLAWHRVYLHYFEQTLRKISGNSAFTLPYWNYTTGPLLSKRVLPAAYRDPTVGAGPNPLFVSERSSDINGGAELSEQVVSTAFALSSTNFDEFQTILEASPHSAIHCAIAGGCPTPLMGDVAQAAKDPIFWAHHANIDRLWNCWRKTTGIHGQPTSFIPPDKPFVFVDADGNLTAPMSANELLDFADQLDVRYQEETDCSDAPPPPIQAKAAAFQPAELGQATSIHVPAQGGFFDIPFGSPPMPLRGGADLVAALHSPKRVVLRLSDVHADKPKTMYAIFAHTGNEKEREVGIISFFGHAAHSSAPRLFDLTQVIADNVPSTAMLHIRLVPTRGLAIEDAEQLEQQARAGSDVAIGAAAIILEK